MLDTAAPRVTVFMAVYNAERYLGQAIDSVLAQSFADFELLVVDDGSTDRSLEIILAYADSRIRVVRNEINRGVAYRRNRALPLARGEYVAVLDADDFALPERLQVQVDYLDEHPDICLVGSACQVINEDGNVETIWHVPTNPLTLRWLLLFGDGIAHSTVMFRREQALAIGGYDPTMLWAQDTDLYTRLVAAGYQLVNLERPLVQWRRHPKSWSNSDPSAREEYPVRLVIRSVGLQTGLEIDVATARCLHRYTQSPSANREVVMNAYATVEHCLATYLRYARNESERRELIWLAMEDVVRLAIHNPSTRLYGTLRLLTYLSRLGLRSCLKYRSLRPVARILPAPKLLVRWLHRMVSGSTFFANRRKR